MIEERLTETFRQVMAGEPPLGFDPDDVVAEAARRIRARRAIAATAAATGVVALTAAALFTTAGTGARVPVGAPLTQVSAPQTKPQPGTNLPSAAPTFPGSDNVVRDLGRTIPAVLADRVPGLHFNGPDSGTLMVVENRRAVGGAYLAAGTKHRYVSVWVYHDKQNLDLAGDPAAGGGWGPLASDTTQQDGSHLRVYRSTEGGAQGLTVVHLRTDGVIVMADTTAKPEPGQTGLATTQQALTAVATDPRLTF
jgi:hypothetical protein